MDRVIKNLREQLFLLRRLVELLDELINDLRQSSSGGGVTMTVHSIESVMPELSKADAQLQKFIKEARVDSISAYIDRQSESVESSVARRLLDQVAKLQPKVQRKLITASMLLVNSKKFIDFNVNVMSRASVGPTYGKSAMTNAQSGRSIFNANV